MEPGLFQEAKRVLLEALALPPETREEHVRRTCSDRPEIAAEVLSLLSRETSLAPVVDAGLVKLPGTTPERIGPYEIIDVVGEGGMGIVYRGRQTAPIHRDVAIKVLHAGMDTARILERFAWERRSLARMNHPNIARILDAGSESGRPYVVLELVDGLPITTWCRENQGAVARRLVLMERVCQAVQHAHDRGVLHRDLKPGNILVRDVDGEPTPYIIDFGIAKALDVSDSGETGPELTIEGQRIGTPAYMSPEQLAGFGHDVDVRTDVYALGMILYELLAGRRPFGDEQLNRTQTREDPPPPSRLSERRELRGDLDNICLMAIRTEPERRYRSAAELGEDLRRHREGRPVLASPDHWRYRLGKNLRRHPALATLGAALGVFAVVGVAFLFYHVNRLDLERDRAIAAESLARQEATAAAEIATFLENLFIEMDPVEEGRAPTTALELLDQGAAMLEDELGDQPANRGRLWGVMGRVNQNLARHELAEQQLRRSLTAFAEAPDSNTSLANRAETWRMLAVCLHDVGRFAESEQAFRHTLAMHERAYPEIDVLRVQLMTDLATTIQAQSRQVEALKLLGEAAALAEGLGAAGREEVAYIRNMRGYVLFQRGHYEESLADMQAALAAQRERMNSDSLEPVISLNNVGGMCAELGRLDEAERYITESKEMLERIFQGENHPALTRANLHLGRIALARGDTARAIRLIEDSYELYVTQLGADHPNSTSAAVSLAAIRQIQGRHDEARLIYEATLAAMVAAGGPNNFKTLDCRRRFGRFLLDTGELAAARRELAAAIAGYEEMNEPDHPRLLETRVDLAAVLLQQGDPAGARPLLRSALPGLTATFGSGSESDRRARALLAETN